MIELVDMLEEDKMGTICGITSWKLLFYIIR